MAAGYKVVLLGEGRVGKTSLLSRFFNGVFEEEQTSTVQATMYTSTGVPLQDGSGATATLNVWDTAGQERFHALGPIYYRNANGALLVYDITDAHTLEKVRMWIRELRAVVGDNIQLVICGNKSDLAGEREVAEDTAVTFAKTHGAQHFETSAKTGANVAEAFQALATAMVRAKSGRGNGGGGGVMTAPPHGRRGKRNVLRVEGNEGEKEGRGKSGVVSAGGACVTEDACGLSSEDYMYTNDPAGKPTRLLMVDFGAPAGFTEKNSSASGKKFSCCT